MGLGLKTESMNTEFEPWVKYDARAGRWFKMDRSQGADGWVTTPTDITNNAVFVADFRNIQVGWVDFGAQGPDYKMVAVGLQQPPQPSVKHRQGFRLSLYSDRNLDGARVWMHNAQCVIRKIDALYDIVVSAPEYAAGQLPVIQMVTTEAVRTEGKDKEGNKVVSTNYAPVFQIVQWVNSPFPDVQPSSSQTVLQTTQPAQLSAIVPSSIQNPAAAAGGPLF